MDQATHNTTVSFIWGMRRREKPSLPRYFHPLFRTPHLAKNAERWSYGITTDDRRVPKMGIFR